MDNISRPIFGRFCQKPADMALRYGRLDLLNTPRPHPANPAATAPGTAAAAVPAAATMGQRGSGAPAGISPCIPTHDQEGQEGIIQPRTPGNVLQPPNNLHPGQHHRGANGRDGTLPSLPPTPTTPTRQGQMQGATSDQREGQYKCRGFRHPPGITRT